MIDHFMILQIKSIKDGGRGRIRDGMGMLTQVKITMQGNLKSGDKIEGCSY